MVTGEVTGSNVTLIPKQKQSDEFKLANPPLMTWSNCLAKVFCLALTRPRHWVMHRKCSTVQMGTFLFSFSGVWSVVDNNNQLFNTSQNGTPHETYAVGFRFKIFTAKTKKSISNLLTASYLLFLSRFTFHMQSALNILFFVVAWKRHAGALDVTKMNHLKCIFCCY